MIQKPKHIAIVGAGPGGLTSAMLLAARGFKVTVLEKQNEVGGRNRPIRLGGYKFDSGPTFLMMKFILDEVFEESGKNVNDYLNFIKLEPMYRLQFDDRMIEPTTDHAALQAQIDRLFPGNEQSMSRFLTREKVRYDLMYPCLQKEYSGFQALFSKEFRRALPHLSLNKSLFQVLGEYFKQDKLKLSFTFQSKYLGMSAWECPGAFGLIPYIEHAFGIYHVMGGLSEISTAMAKAAAEMGAVIRTSTPARQLLLDGKKVIGVELEDGERLLADQVVVNADFAQAMSHLVAPDILKRYSLKNLHKRKYSCSTFMLYLGLDKVYPEMPHHTIVFAKGYRRNIEDIFKRKVLSEDLSFYVRNASVNDASLAPKGKSAVYVLVPTPNQSSGIDWSKTATVYRDRVLDLIEQRTTMKDLRKHIEVEKVITPADWVKDYDVFQGATFNLSHQLDQMLYLRPHNHFEELRNCYLVGGGTHPGSGLPTIYESGRITANLISNLYQIPYTSKNLQVSP